MSSPDRLSLAAEALTHARMRYDLVSAQNTSGLSAKQLALLEQSYQLAKHQLSQAENEMQKALCQSGQDSVIAHDTIH